jgi:hypothetical protein
MTLTSSSVIGFCAPSSRRFCLSQAIRTATPVGDFGLVDCVAHVRDGRETGGGADGAIDVYHAAADATDQMVVIVADAIFETSR